MDHNVTVDHGYRSEGDGGRADVCIAERRAATCGFMAEKIRISPSALLDSPIMLPNAQASPTTGTFPLPLLNQGGQVPSISSALLEIPSLLCLKKYPYDCRSLFLLGLGVGQSSAFSDATHLKVSSSFDAVQKAGDSYQPLVHLDTPLDFEFPAEFSKEAASASFAADSVTEVKVLNNIVNDNVNLGFHPSELASARKSMQKVPFKGQDVGTNPSEGDLKGTNTAIGTTRTSEDGYNWRKYGQKQVKGCAHNHSKPQPCHPSLGSSLSSNEISESTEDSGTCIKVEGGLIWKTAQAGSKDIKLASDSRADGLEITSSTHDGDKATQGSISLCGDAANDDESGSKRRKTEMNVASGALREPRVVVQIESDVEILDDGYRWRKYGQKELLQMHKSWMSCEKACGKSFPQSKMRARNMRKTQSWSSSNQKQPEAAVMLTQVPNTKSDLALSRNAHAVMPETPIQAISYGSFGLNPNCIATHSSGSIASSVPNFPISMPLNLPTSANLCLAGFDINNVGKPTGLIHSFLPGQQFKDNATRFHGIKQELKDDNHYDPCLPIVDHESTTLSSSSIFQPAAGNFPS
ncbi:hypothetical protein V6N13_136626 [Hibiscus sabdariffa]